MSEAFAMADRAGVSRQGLYDVMSAGPLKSGMMDFIKAYAIDGVPDTLAFSVGNAAKDVGYYVRMTEGLGADTVMARCADTALKEAAGGDMRDRMVPEMVDFYAKRFGG
jgi:3-hydroxyisobutyrate dehydrogenase-like beta-hydroxyacid dehydrogenase